MIQKNCKPDRIESPPAFNKTAKLNDNSMFNSRFANATPLNERMSIREGTILYTTIQPVPDQKRKSSSQMLRRKSNTSQTSKNAEKIANIKVSTSKKSPYVKIGTGIKNSEMSDASFLYQHSVSEKKKSESDISQNEV